MGTNYFVVDFILIVVEAIIQGFDWFFAILGAHDADLLPLYWGVLFTVLIYRFLIKPGLNNNRNHSDSSGPGSDWSA